MNNLKQDTVWIFHGESGRFASGIFTSLGKAMSWISNHKLTGLLTEYPIDEGVFDWAIQNGYFEIKNEKHSEPKFIQSFTTASQEHYHFENGERQ